LLTLSQLAHNLLVWFKEWLTKQGKHLLSALGPPTVESGIPLPQIEGEATIAPNGGTTFGGLKPRGKEKSVLLSFIRQLSGYGIVRFIGQIVKIS
jgi:hypothetical protein